MAFNPATSRPVQAQRTVAPVIAQPSPVQSPRPTGATVCTRAYEDETIADLFGERIEVREVRNIDAELAELMRAVVDLKKEKDAQDKAFDAKLRGIYNLIKKAREA
jgi:hypothetical protein